MSERAPKTGQTQQRVTGGRRRKRTKADLVDGVYRSHGALTRDEAAEAVDAVFSAIKGALAEGQPVKLRKLGVFRVVDRAPRRGVDPSRGEPIRIPAHRALAFHPSRDLQTVVGGDEG